MSKRNFDSKGGSGSGKTSSSCIWYVLYFVFFAWAIILYVYHSNKSAALAASASAAASAEKMSALISSKLASASASLAATANHLRPHEDVPVDHASISAAESAGEHHHEEASSSISEHPSSATSNAAVPAVSSSGDDDRMHIVFSTDCSFFQDWQTLLVFYTATKVGQKGKITRIASGCSQEKQDELVSLYKELFPQYGAHFTPDFKMDSKTQKKYDFYNKPYGLHHWLQHANPPIDDGVVVILIDPDMIILRPFTLDFAKNPTNIFYDTSIKPGITEVPSKIGKGVPVAQIYGLGAPWAQEGRRRNGDNFNRTKICGADSPCLKVDVHYGELHYSVGPPYFVEKTDLLALTDSWTDFVPKVYADYPELLAEMYAYSMAAAHNNLPHYIMRHYMVSNIDMDEEGWSYIDALKDEVCEYPVDGIYYPGKPLPNILHYCQFYRSGEFGFQKRRLRKTIFDCDKPLLAAIPTDQGLVRYKNRDGEIMKIGPKQGRRGSFMLCAVHRAINEMVLYYRSKKCKPGEIINRNETVSLVDKKYW